MAVRVRDYHMSLVTTTTMATLITAAIAIAIVITAPIIIATNLHRGKRHAG